MDAYYSVRMAKQLRKCLRFEFDEKLYEYTSLPNGLACATRIFTQLMQPVYATLRLRGLIYACRIY